MRVVMVHHRWFHGHTPFTRHALLLSVAEAALVHTFCSKALGKWRRRAPSGE